MTTDVKLLPCPFCGRDEHLQVEHLEGTVVHPAYRVRCHWCGASTGYTDTDCRKVWNERANMAELLAENERLRGESARQRRSLNEAIVHGNRQTGRAERLAEALREAADDLERGIDARIVVAQLRAALDQEGGNE